MNILLQTIHIFGAIFLILVVLLQSGRGGGMGAAFGGAAGQIFGGRGASNFLTRVTTGAAIFFFMTSLSLSMLSSRHRSVVQDQVVKTPVKADSAPATAPAHTDSAPPASSTAPAQP
jgi:preprotein translocase subunit SecG